MSKLDCLAFYGGSPADLKNEMRALANVRARRPPVTGRLSAWTEAGFIFVYVDGWGWPISCFTVRGGRLRRVSRDEYERLRAARSVPISEWGPNVVPIRRPA